MVQIGYKFRYFSFVFLLTQTFHSDKAVQCVGYIYSNWILFNVSGLFPASWKVLSPGFEHSGDVGLCVAKSAQTWQFFVTMETP